MVFYSPCSNLLQGEEKVTRQESNLQEKMKEINVLQEKLLQSNNGDFHDQKIEIECLG